MKKLLLFFLNSRIFRGLVASTVAAAMAWLAGWLAGMGIAIPEELLLQTQAGIIAFCLWIVPEIAVKCLKDGGRAAQTELNKTLEPASRVKVDGVILEDGPTMHAQAAVVRNADNDLHVPKKHRPRPPVTPHGPNR